MLLYQRQEDDIMRQMIKDLEEKPIETSEKSRLELHGLSRKEKRRIKKEQLQETIADMTTGQKIKYLLYYYKEAIIVSVILIISAAFICSTVYQNTRPIVISYAVANCVNQLEFNADAVDDYAKSINKFDGYQIKGDTNIVLNKEEYSNEYEANPNSQKYITFMTMATSDYYDVIFTNDEGAEYCANMDIFYPLNKYLDPDTYNMVKDDIIMYKDMNGNPVEAAIDISGTDFAKSLNLGYKDVYIGFPGDEARNHQAVRDLILYLYNK